MKHHFIVNILLLVVAIFLIVSVVFGYDSGLEPIVMGHSSNEVSGTVVGGAFALYNGDGDCSDAWGGGVECVNDYGQLKLVCPTGSTKRLTGKSPYSPYKDIYLCIKD